MRKLQDVPARYIYLKDNKELVHGAKYALVIDFETGGLHRLNASASQILNACEKGTSVEKAIKQINIDVESTESLILSMQSQDLITIEQEPQNIKSKTIAKPPLKLDFIWIETTSRCNLRCIHCYAEATTKKTVEPNKSQIFDWLDQAAAIGCRNVQFTGGECTLRNDIRELITHAVSKNYETIEIFTNGNSLDESLISFLADNNIQIAISLYSYKSKSHDIISGVKGSHKKTLQSLKLLLAYGVSVRGSIIAMKQNEKELEATQLFLHELGVISAPADPIRPCGRGSSLKDWPKEYGSNIMRTKPDFHANRSLFEKNQHWNSCWFGKAAITPEGYVLPCVFARDQVAGNLNDHSLEWIMKNGLLSFWELTRDKISVCCDCEYRYICRDCRPWAYGYTDKIDSKTPTCTYNPYTGEWGSAKLIP